MTKGREARKPRSVAPLPLLPMPVYDGEAQQEALLELALEKAADQHPELVEGPDIDDTFALGATIRQDGTLLGSTVKLATRAELRDATAEVRREMPADGAGGSGGGRSKHSLLQDGRMLRADISFWVAIVPNNYDITRSNVRVLQILGDRHADLMLPATGGEMNRLTVLLSDDGHVQREKVDRLDPQTQSGKTLLGGDSNDVAFLAQDIADRLEVDVSQIGLMGITNMEKGSRVLIMDANGGVRPDDRRQVLIVYYAWLRRAGEAGPAWGQNSSTAGRSSLDESAALRIVEQMIPDAFTLKDPAAGEPTVVLTAKGEVIRAGRVNFRKNGGGAMDAILQQQLVPGVRTSSYSMVRLRNHLDETADVNFAWEVPAH
ncbi:MAG TPA: hypothetical protein VMH77_02615 [Steroidobacteraceae bacterium]|nr:hypothetical protein [Steroidobacteraceae bacterium]